MDTRTSKVYPSQASALAAGVAPESMREVVTIASGPFKGRQYVRQPDGTLGRRVKVQDGHVRPVRNKTR